ncbi:PAS domain-containing protein [Spirosoma luteolum]
MYSSSPTPTNLLQSAVDAAPGGMLVFRIIPSPIEKSADLRLTLINPIAETDLGRPAVDLINESFRVVLPTLANSPQMAAIMNVVETGQSAYFETISPLPHQPNRYWTNVTVVCIDDSLVLSYDCLADRADQPTNDWHHSIYQQAFAQSATGILVFEAIEDEGGHVTDFRLVIVNNAALRMMKQHRDDVEGRTLWETSPAAFVNGSFTLYCQVYATQQPVNDEQYYPGDDIWRERSINPVPRGIMLSYTDSTARHKSEEAAGQNALLLNDVLENVPMGVMVLNAVRNRDEFSHSLSDFRIAMVNTELARVLGRPTTGLIDHLLTVVFDNAGTSGLLSRCVACLELAESQEFEMPFGTPTDSGWYRVSITPNGEQLVLATTNITQIKQSQLAHHFQAELLQSISDNTPAGLVLWEAVRDKSPDRNLIDFRYRMTNLMNSFVTGYPPEALIGHNLLTLFPRFRNTELELALRKTVETGRTQRLNFTYYTERPDSWYDAQLIRVGDGVLMTFMDITEARRTQLVHQQQADLLNTVINAQQSGIVLFEPLRYAAADDSPLAVRDFSVLLINQSARRFWDDPSRLQVGKRLERDLNQGGSTILLEQALLVQETGQSVQWVDKVVRDGTTRWFQALLVPSGKNVLLTCTETDEPLPELNPVELTTAPDPLLQFANLAVTELQEPLRKIQAFGENADAPEPLFLNPVSQEIVGRVRQSAGRLAGLVRDLLQYAAVATPPTRQEPVPLNELLLDILDTLSAGIQASGAIIDCQPLPTIYGDRKQLRHLFQQLLANAIKFHRTGATPKIQLSARQVHAHELPATVMALPVIAAHRAVMYHLISISDNGIGFDDTFSEQIFQIFQRLHHKRSYPGSGTGLAVCRQVATNHMGAITGSSTPGRGATFTVYLPVQAH